MMIDGRGFPPVASLALVAAVIAGLPAGADDGRPPAVTTLRVATYNVQFLPDPVSWKNERPLPEYRARRIGEELREFDIVALQEVFHPRHREILVDHLRGGWGEVHYVVSPQPAGFHTSGGCAILSRWPILKSSAIVFENYSRPEDYGLRADGFAAKGVIHARIAREAHEPENFLDVFVTHLEARADDLRPLQYQGLARFVRETAAVDRPVLVMGDFNTYGMVEYQQDPNSQYSSLLRALRAARPNGDVVDLWPRLKGAAHGGTTNQESCEIGKRIDFILLASPEDPGCALTPISTEVRLYQDEKSGALSDHNAVVAEVEWPAARR